MFLLTCVERLVVLLARRWVVASRRMIWLLSELQTYVLFVQAVVYGSVLTYLLPSLQVSELAEEQELRDLFERFGRVTRVFLARDRETQRAKGFAFISYADRGDAARACEKMDGCMCSLLSRAFQGHDHGHLETPKLTISSPLYYSRLPPPYSSRRVRQAHYLNSLLVFPFTTHFLAGFSFLFIFQAGLAIC
jgi:hypothetical protein